MSELAGKRYRVKKPRGKSRGLNLRARLAQARPFADFEWPFAVIVIIMVAFGLVMVFSASYVTAYYRFGDSFNFIRKQALFAVIGLIAMFVISHIDYRILYKWAFPLMGFAIFLLVIVLFMPEISNTHRWITLPIGGTFQPSELAKFAVIVLFARIMTANADKMKKFQYGVLPFVMILGVIVALMILEPHLSGSVLILAIGATMMFVGGTSLFWFILAVGGAAAAVVCVIVVFPDLVWYAESRLEFWLDPFSDALGAGHQTIQSMYAISSGGLFGVGIGNSAQKYLYLPEPHNDFIFAILCEELGFIGALLVIFLFVALLVRGLQIAFNAADRFGSLLVIGIITQITVQAVLNIAVVTNTIPNTGISLPFFSYGGTSLFMLLCEVGVVLSVARRSGAKKT